MFHLLANRPSPTELEGRCLERWHSVDNVKFTEYFDVNDIEHYSIQCFASG